jgi:hypothetical protein
VHLVGFCYKNISRCTVLWMSNQCHVLLSLVVTYFWEKNRRGTSSWFVSEKSISIFYWKNIRALRIIPCTLVFWTQYVSSFIFELEISVERLLYGFTIELVVLGFWIVFIVLCSKNIRKQSQIFGSCPYIRLWGAAAYVSLFYSTMETGPVSKALF